MGVDENRELVRRYFEVVWMNSEWDRVPEFIAENFVNHGSITGMPSTNIEDARRIDASMRKSFPDIVFQLPRIAADETMVARHWTATATHRGEFMGIPPTGRHVQMQGMVFSRIENGKIVEEWRVVDNAGLWQQLTDGTQ